jgi:hypothetical protein
LHVAQYELELEPEPDRVPPQVGQYVPPAAFVAPLGTPPLAAETLDTRAADELLLL